MDTLDYYEAVYAFVRTIPAGKVVTYGQVAEEIGEWRLTARMVGSAMHYVPEGVPWQRVIGAGGYLSIAKRSPDLYREQRRLLESEGVTFLSEDSPRVNMRLHQWIEETTGQGTLFEEEG